MSARRSKRLKQSTKKRKYVAESFQQSWVQDSDLDIPDNYSDDSVVDGEACDDSGSCRDEWNEADVDQSTWVPRGAYGGDFQLRGGEFCTLSTKGTREVVAQAQLLRAIGGPVIVRIEQTVEECAIASVCISKEQLLQMIPRANWPGPLQREPPQNQELILLEDLNVEVGYEYIASLCPVTLALPFEITTELFTYRTLNAVTENVRVLVESTGSKQPPLAALWPTYRGEQITSNHALCVALRQLGASSCCWYGTSTHNKLHDPLVKVLSQCQPPVPTGDRTAMRGTCDACHRLRNGSDYVVGRKIVRLGKDCAERLRAVGWLQNSMHWHYTQGHGPEQAIGELIRCAETCAEVVDRQAQMYKAKSAQEKR